jgi:hypothetical protein
VYAKSDSDQWDQYMPDEPMFKDVASTTDQNWKILQDDHRTFTDEVFVTITSEDATLVVKSEGEQKQEEGRQSPTVTANEAQDLNLDVGNAILELDLEGQLDEEPPRIVVNTFLELYSVPPRSAQKLQKFPSETTRNDKTPRRYKLVHRYQGVHGCDERCPALHVHEE